MRVLVNGAGGRIGACVQRAAKEGFHGAELAAAVSVRDGSLERFNGPADCIIDFSDRAATAPLLEYALGRGLPVVIATTGQTEQDMEQIRRAAESIPVFRSGNMALGVTLMCQLVKTAVKAFPGAQVEILEIHHTGKADVPSGTAVMLGEAALKVRPGAHLTVGRPAGHGLRDENEITIHSLRMGNIVGTHEVIINAGTQVLTLKHEALDRAMFAEGAIIAAEFLLRQKPGLYDMQDLAATL